MSDIRYAIRLLLKTPGFTLIAVVTLALGIGATTAIFTGVNAVLLRPLPYPDADRLLFVWEAFGKNRAGVTAPDYLDWQRDQRVFAHLAAYRSTMVTLTDGGESERVLARRVAAEYFRVLDVPPVIGRGFTAADEPYDAPRTVLLSDATWRVRFNADPAVLGRTLIVDGERATIIGVVPREVSMFEREEQFYLPLALTPDEQRQPGNHFLTVIARLRPDVTTATAEDAMKAIAARIGDIRPGSNREVSVRLDDMHEALATDLRQPVLLFMGAVGLLLVIACANVANLQLVRATARQREIAIRTALGAGRGRIIRQLLIESVVLATLGGLLGLLLAAWASDLMPWIVPDLAPFVAGATFDLRVGLFALAATMATGVFFGLAPAWQLSRRDLRNRLSDGARGTTGADRHRISAVFVVIEIALALTLLIGAGLLVRSFLKLQAVDPGFRSDGVLALRISLPEVRYREDAQPGAFYSLLLDRLRAMPGVKAAGASTTLPLRDTGGGLVAIIDGRPKPTKMSEFAYFSHRAIIPGYFATLGVPMLSGRDLTTDDRAGRPRVAVINRTAARRYWPKGDAIGARMSPDDDGGPAEIVGIVADMKGFGLGRETAPEMFISALQPPPPLWLWTQRTMDVVVQTAGDPAQSAAPIRAIVRELDPTLPVYRVATLNEVVTESVGTPRRYVLLVTTFGAIALLLAALGIYGVMAFIVSARTHEIGVRVALGAARHDIMTLVLGRSLRFCAIGLGLGVALALGMSRYVASLLFGITATDLTTYVVVSAILVAAAMLATYLPARRAMRVNPLIALRAD